MYKLWCLLIYGYVPQWEIYNQGPIYEDKSMSKPIGRWYDMRCTQTGSIKRNNVYTP